MSTAALPTGLVRNEPSEVYHGAPAWSKSKLDDFRELPLLAYLRHVQKTLPREEETDALRIGKSAHVLTLEGLEAYSKRYVIVPGDAPKKPTTLQRKAKKPSPETVTAIQWWDEFTKANAGKEVLSREDDWINRKIAPAVWQHTTAGLLLERCEPEITFRVNTPRYQLQCRPDGFAEKGASRELVDLLRRQGIRMDEGEPYDVDLKTVDSLSEMAFRTFAKNFVNCGYHRQGPFYTSVQRDVLGYSVEKFFYIVVEKQEPFSVAIFLADDEANKVGWEEVCNDIKSLNECYDTGVWPGVTPNVQSVKLPGWYLKKHDIEEGAA